MRRRNPRSPYIDIFKAAQQRGYKLAKEAEEAIANEVEEALAVTGLVPAAPTEATHTATVATSQGVVDVPVRKGADLAPAPAPPSFDEFVQRSIGRDLEAIKATTPESINKYVEAAEDPGRALFEIYTNTNKLKTEASKYRAPLGYLHASSILYALDGWSKRPQDFPLAAQYGVEVLNFNEEADLAAEAGRAERKANKLFREKYESAYFIPRDNPESDDVVTPEWLSEMLASLGGRKRKARAAEPAPVPMLAEPVVEVAPAPPPPALTPSTVPSFDEFIQRRLASWHKRNKPVSFEGLTESAAEGNRSVEHVINTAVFTAQNAIEGIQVYAAVKDVRTIIDWIVATNNYRKDNLSFFKKIVDKHEPRAMQMFRAEYEKKYGVSPPRSNPRFIRHPNQ